MPVIIPRNVLLLSLLIVVANCHAQDKSKDSLKIEANFYLAAMEGACDSGHFQRMDTLYEEYKRSDSYSLEARFRIRELRILIHRLEVDGYHPQELETLTKSLHKITDSFNRRTVNASYRVFRIGVVGGANLTTIGPPGGVIGIVAGFHIQPGKIEKNGVGIDLGFYRQNFPFNLNLVNNKNGDNDYISNGYLLKTKGNISFSAADLRVSILERTSSEDIPGGISLFVGFGWKHIRETYIDRYYYEHQYLPSRSGLDSGSVSYLATDSSSYRDNSFFTKGDFFFVPVGARVYVMPVEHLMISLEASFTFNVGNRLIISTTNYRLPPNYTSSRLAIYYLLGKKKIIERHVRKHYPEIFDL